MPEDLCEGDQEMEETLKSLSTWLVPVLRLSHERLKTNPLVQCKHVQMCHLVRINKYNKIGPIFLSREAMKIFAL